MPKKSANTGSALFDTPIIRHDEGYDSERWRDDVQPTKRCHYNHKPLEIGGGVLHGGNCRDHFHLGRMDLYVALDACMQHPYFENASDVPRAVYYPIRNMQIPNRPDKFIALVDLIVKELSEGHTVHVGCIGGHGRTGLVIAAVVARLGLAGEDNDAIKWVREHYCKKAVETSSQEGFLVTHFGVKPKATKEGVDKSTMDF